MHKLPSLQRLGMLRRLELEETGEVQALFSETPARRRLLVEDAGGHGAGRRDLAVNIRQSLHPFVHGLVRIIGEVRFRRCRTGPLREDGDRVLWADWRGVSRRRNGRDHCRPNRDRQEWPPIPSPEYFRTSTQACMSVQMRALRELWTAQDVVGAMPHRSPRVTAFTCRYSSMP